MNRRKQGIEPRKNYTVRLSAKEHKILEREAKESGMKPSEYIRELIINGGLVDIFLPEQRRDLINQIARIGNNINQIAHRANADRWITERTLYMVADSMKEIEKLMKEVLVLWR